MIGQIADTIDMGVVVLLAVGLLWALAREVKRSSGLGMDAFSSKNLRVAIREIRLNLGQVLLLALEVLIVSDILHSISHRTLNELIMLAGTVGIRVILAYFLDREVDHLDRQNGGNLT